MVISTKSGLQNEVMRMNSGKLKPKKVKTLPNGQLARRASDPQDLRVIYFRAKRSLHFSFAHGLLSWVFPSENAFTILL